MSNQRIVHLGDPQSSHWVQTFLYARDRMLEYRAQMDEAREAFMDQLGDDWDVIEVDGLPVIEQVRTEPSRFSVNDLKKQYPAIYQELVKKVPQTAVKVL